MKIWQDPSLTLGERCVAFAANELANGVAEDKPNSYTSPRLREYFKICTRLVNGKETPIGLTFTAGNWCSAGVSFCLHESLLPGETHPHGYRLGVVEVMADMQKLGTYRSITEAKNGSYQLKVGDPIFFDRSNPSNPASAWWRHIGRVHSVGAGGKFTCISGNSGGKWRLSNHDLTQKNLLGFGEYTTLTAVANPNVSIDWEHVSIDDLAPSQDTGKDLSVDNVWDIFTHNIKV
jgi:hypothetical protein